MPVYSTTILSTMGAAGSHNGEFSPSYLITDVNGDGRPDLVAAFLNPTTFAPTPMKIFLGDGTGHFSDATATYLPGGATTEGPSGDIVTADFNRDGRLDFLVADFGADAPPFPGGQNVLLLSQAVSFKAAGSDFLPPVTALTHTTAAGDIDADGDIDIFVGSLGSTPGVSVNYGAFFEINGGGGNFTVDRSLLPAGSELANSERFTGSALVDIDSDGDVDLVVGGMHEADRTGLNHVLLNDGRGHFSNGPALPDTYTGRSSSVVDVDVLDLNGDGKSDIVFTYALDAYQSSAVQVLINTGSGFADQSATWLKPDFTEGLSRLTFVDVNNDGLVDIVQSGGTTDPILLNTGLGSFIRAPGVFHSDWYDLRRVADLNDDGRLDIVATPGTVNGAYHVNAYLGVDGGLSQVSEASGSTLMGDSDSEHLTGLGGADVIFGAQGNDTVSAGDGNDTVYAGVGNDSIAGGAGDDYLRGNEGDDFFVGDGGFDDINGNMGNDTESGGLGDDWVVGGKDNDRLSGDAGSDVVWGNLGADNLSGGDDNDQVRGGQGYDSVSGGAGDDFVSGDRGNDTITGGTGADLFHGSQDAGIDRVLDFNLAEGDRVMLDPGTTYTLRYDGADTILDMGGANAMTLVGVHLAEGGWVFTG